MQLKRRNRQGGGPLCLFKNVVIYILIQVKGQTKTQQNSFSQFIYNRKPFDSVYFFFINI